MRALQFDVNVPRYVASRALGAVSPRALWGRFSALRYKQVPEPPLRGDEWVRVATRLGGICGSDMHLLHLDISVSASVFASFPFVPGHENMGTLVEVGGAAGDLRVGQRVVVDPVLGCATRGITPPCAPCAAGDYNLCLRYTDGALSPALGIGSCRDTGGSWGESFVAHRSQVFPLPDTISDGNALMVEPLAVAVHPLLRHRPPDGATVLVVGGGVIGQCAIAALRALGSTARVIALVKYPFQAEMARRLGAEAAVLLGRGDAPYQAIAEFTQGVLRRPMLGKRILIGGADLTVECVGTARSLDDALRLTRSGGTVLVLGLAALPRGVDWTPVWLNELHVTGSYAYGTDTWEGVRRRTFDIVLELMQRGAVDLSPLLTHTYPLEAYAQAFTTAMGKATTSAFKVAFQFTSAGQGPGG